MIQSRKGYFIVLFHSINFSGSCWNHFDALYPFTSKCYLGVAHPHTY